jgi:N-methylhydantoinase A
MTHRIGVDIGGTFTDLTLLRDDGSVVLWKEDSTPERHEEAIGRGLQGLAASEGLSLGDLLSEVELFVHGSTIATNAVIQRSGPRLGLVCTNGFRDVLYLRDGFKWDRYNLHLRRPDDFVPRHLRIGVRERIGSEGQIVRRLEEDDVRAASRSFREQSVDAVAVALLWSHLNPIHEQRTREILAVEMPDVPVILSSDVLPEIGEWVRTSATVLSAYAYPASSRYLRQISHDLREAGLGVDLRIMQLNGGCADVEQSLRVPTNLIASGPAAGPAAAIQVGRRAASENLIEVDMGGTSFDVCLITGGQIPRSRGLMVERQPLGIPGVEIHSIGAGGGSIAWIDSGGALRVGPRSAGSRPGPVAYAQGGTEPTVTDADVVLGYLSPETFHAGRRKLRTDLAERAVHDRIGAPLSIPTIEAAAGIVRVVNENMVNAIRVVSIEKGIDPRPYTLVAGGGAGPVHAGRLAAELGIGRVLVPREAGTLSAFGMAVTDVRHDYSGTAYATTSSWDAAAIEGLLKQLSQRASDDLRRAGFDPAQTELRRAVDARYLGQVHELIVPAPDGPISGDLIATLAERFHAAHRERYAWDMLKHPVEFLHWRVTGIGRIPRPREAAIHETGARPASPSGSRRAYFEEVGGYVEVPTFDAAALTSGGLVEGPAIIDAATTTVVVYPGHRAIGDGTGNYLMFTGGGESMILGAALYPVAAS